MLRGDTQLLAVVCRYTAVRWSTAWLETGEDACDGLCGGVRVSLVLEPLPM